MSRNVEDDKIPYQVKKLMRLEAKRGFGETVASCERYQYFRNSYCTFFENELFESEEWHWGLTLKEKMNKFPDAAWNALKSWGSYHGINFVTDYGDDKETFLNFFRNRLNILAIKTNKWLYEDSLYGSLLAMLDNL